MSMMNQVTHAEFFAALNADPRDIMPMIVSGWDETTGYTSEWRDQKSAGRELFGKSDGDGDRARFWLRKLGEEE